MFPGCFRGVSGVSPGCFRGVSGVFRGCFRSVSGVFPGCLRGVSGVFPGCFRCVSGVFPECFRGVSGVFPGCFRGVSGVFPVCFRCVSGVFPVPSYPVVDPQKLSRGRFFWALGRRGNSPKGKAGPASGLSAFSSSSPSVDMRTAPGLHASPGAFTVTGKTPAKRGPKGGHLAVRQSPCHQFRGPSFRGWAPESWHTAPKELSCPVLASRVAQATAALPAIAGRRGFPTSA